ncbi:serine hydrolase [Listeria cossartiae subsp. cayugensis]|uniref:Serine hydrolase n=1 Tax=Listeria cossartiae subsp. cayugensis TaxID=2713505 RepID=A0ABU2ILY5_9LIST|nr:MULTISPECIES: serine hydrolase [Listeria]MBC2126754.1 serine hydrolase [Listeria marthii]MDT0001246.1 serine hydrolase [Listeria cossartiae subsp. cayugensis]MDT0009532.1 serine hydrolase [Listeria cossartiae subsp. cayugensis]MDT0013972.1 serine hydrolase [Listeria cossartiae subsp. cayugensis]MDT0031276.1 serine hydrolase [Listeria cossartiae subsp. cayugensis]
MNRRERRKQKRRKNLIIVLSTVFLLFIATSWMIFEFKSKQQQTVSSPTKKKAATTAKPPEDSGTKKEETKEPEPAEEKPKETIVKNQEIDDYLQKIGFSGSALVVRDGEIIIQKGYLYANRDEEVLNTPDTLFYIGSSQKAIIATALLQLEEKGKISTNDPISKYIPNFPNGNKILVKNFLNHTSGIVGRPKLTSNMTPDQLIQAIEKRGIKSQPGKWDYMDANYTVVGYLVEKVSGKPLATYLQENIFDPAGMKHTGYLQKDVDGGKNVSIGYKIDDNGIFQSPKLVDLSQLYGSGDISMNATDLYLFDKALMDKKLISEASLKKMFTPGSKSTYGMGFYVDPGSYNSHGVVTGWDVSNSVSHTGRTYVVLFSNVQNHIASFGKVNNDIYGFLNK